MKLLREHRAENAREKDVEQIEERPDPRDRDDQAMRSRDGQSIETCRYLRNDGSLAEWTARYCGQRQSSTDGMSWPCSRM
jgi:hypothetical protein